MNADDDHPTVAEAESGAEHARADLVSTLNQLRENLRPANVVDEVMSNAKVGASQVSDQIWDLARKNPLPALMIGAGAAMILGFGTQRATSGRRTTGVDVGRTAPRSTLGARSSEFVQRSVGAATDGASRSADLLGAANDRLASAATRGAGAISQAFKRTNTSGDPMSYISHDTKSRVRSSLARILDEQPLVLAAIGVAVGAALGAAIPQTETENSLLGETAGSVRGAAQDVAQQQYAQLRSAAQHAVEDIKQTAADRGVTSENLSGLVHDVTDKAKAAASEAGRSLDPTT